MAIIMSIIKYIFRFVKSIFKSIGKFGKTIKTSLGKLKIFVGGQLRDMILWKLLVGGASLCTLLVLSLIIANNVEASVGKIVYDELAVEEKAAAEEARTIKKTFEVSIHPESTVFYSTIDRYYDYEETLDSLYEDYDECMITKVNQSLCGELKDDINVLEYYWFEISLSDETLVEYAEIAIEDYGEIQKHLSSIRVENELQPYLDAMISCLDAIIAIYEDFINSVAEFGTINANNIYDFYTTLEDTIRVAEIAKDNIQVQKELSYAQYVTSNIEHDGLFNLVK